jgi:general nucleoside transport system permease protein
MDLRRLGFILAIIIILFGVVVGIAKTATPPVVIIASLIATTIAVATPLTLGALCGVFCERAGVVNIGIEGMMLSGAFFGWLASIYVAKVFHPAVGVSLVVGLFMALFSAGLFALLHAVLSITFKVDQIIGGTVINILAVGLTGFLNRQLFFGRNSVFGGEIPNGPGLLPRVNLPITQLFERFCGGGEQCLLVGKSLDKIFDQQMIAISAIVLVFVVHYILFSTRWGLRTRSVGEHPRAADTVGINVYFMRYANVIIGGLFAGLAGAYFTLESQPSFEPVMTNGRGFIALAAMIFGNWTPIGAWGASLLFGAAQALQINLQFYRDLIPHQFAFLQQSYIVGQAPYILTMIVLAGVVGKTTPPAADGVPYEK